VRGAGVVSPRSRSSRTPVLTRVGELLTGHPVVWLTGLAVGITSLVLTSLVGTVPAVVVAVVLLIAATIVIMFKDRVLILRRRILVTRQPLSRRQFIATGVSVAITTALSVGLGWMLRAFIFSSYEEQLRQHQRPKKKPKASSR
jgi:hypothetical protein